MDSSDFAQQFGSTDFSSGFDFYKTAPVTFPVSSPAPPASYGAINRGFTDVSGGQDAATRQAIINRQNNLNLVAAYAGVAANLFGTIKRDTSPLYYHSTTGYPALGPYGPQSYIPGVGFGLTPDQKMLLLVGVGILLVYALTKKG